MKSIIKSLKIFVFIISAILSISACNSYNLATGGNTAVISNSKLKESSYQKKNEVIENTSVVGLDENGSYTSKEDVALYIYTYKKLPKNFITKNEAKKLGWDNSENYVGDVAKGKSIGGDRFGNYEKLLPVKKGRIYYECDIDYKGKKRNGKRIIYADDYDEDIGFIYYTDDHYKTFERLY